MLKRPCKFYNTTGKCAFGKHCKFSHSIEISHKTATSTREKDGAVSETNTANTAESISSNSASLLDQHHDDCLKESSEGTASHPQLTFQCSSSNPNKNGSLKSTSKRNICRFFAKNRFCQFGRRCRFEHVLPATRENVHASESRDEKVENTTACNQDDVTTETREQDKVQDEDLPNKKSDESKDVNTTNDQLPESKKKQPRKKLCHFFKQGYCRFGNNCKFYHPTKQLKPGTEEIKGVGKQTVDYTVVDDKTAGNQVNKIAKENEPGVADDGFRQVTRKVRVVNVYERKDIDETKQKELRQTEIQQLKRRFPSDKIRTLEETEKKAAYVVTFLPSDPDWPFDVKAFDIQVEFPEEYPLQLFSVSLPLDQDLPATVRRYIEVSLQEWTEKKKKEGVEKDITELYFRPFLRWMDRNMETIVTEGLKQLRRELTAKAAGLQFISASELKKDVEKDGSENEENTEDFDNRDTRRPVAYRKSDYVDERYEVPKQNSGDESGDSDDDDSSQDDDEQTGDNMAHQRPAVSADTERRGTELTFRNMQIWYCTTIMVEKLWLTVQCERCKNTTDFSTPPNRVNSVPCGKCNFNQLVVFRPVLAHSYSSTFGYLDLDGCSAFDVVLQNCHLSMGCIMCSRDILVKKFIPGKLLDIFCRNCHNKMQFAADSVKFQVITTSEVDASKFSGRVHQVSVKRAVRNLKDPAIQPGKPLPNTGACKHYKKSYRWLRFPCCGKCYPCDVCHDEKEDHEMKFANRMICGFCCKEQPFSVEKPCSGCSSSLTKVHTTHWEGGKGCRNKITMSRSDEKKYTNMNKTLSNKAKGVAEKNKGKKTTKLRHT